MKIYMDLHTHTVAAGHGYSTLKENIDAARAAGILYLGLSEHGPAVPGGPHRNFFGNYRCIPRQYGELRLFCGAEADVMDFEGSLDLDENMLSRIDYVIASMHISCVKPGSREENTLAAIRAMENPYVNILGHPDDSRYPLDYEELVKAAKREGVALELNNASLNHPARQDGRKNILTLLNICKKYDTPIVLGTDSHVCYTVGHFEEALEALREADFPEELVLNTDPKNIARLVNVSI